MKPWLILGRWVSTALNAVSLGKFFFFLNYAWHAVSSACVIETAVVAFTAVLLARQHYE